MFPQVWSHDGQLHNDERELNAELVDFAVERDYGGGGGGGSNEQQGVALTTIEIGGVTSTTEIEVVSENDVGGDLGSFTHFVGNLDNLVYFNEEELCGEVLESFHIQVCKR